MQAPHAKLAAHHALAPFSLRFGALALAAILVGVVLLETAHVAAGIVV
jgi:hypothetical protein